MIAVAQWLRNWVFNKEATGSNAGFFMHLFYLTVTVLLEYINPVIYSCLVFVNHKGFEL